jgi:tRNA-modifying protein YgfZ
MSALVTLSQYSIIQVTGEDAVSFLQGQVTCDMTKLSSSDWLAGCHCNAKGKMWSTFVAKQIDDSIYLIATKDSAAASLAELTKYGVFAKAEITDVTENWHLYGGKAPRNGAINFALSENHVLIISEVSLPSNEDSSEWWFDEVASGRAHLFAATIGEYVPQMLNLQALDYISFNKGCYMGQETVARMRYLGKNKRALFPASISQAEDFKPGQDVYVSLNGNRRAQGKVINSCTFNNETIAQLVLPKDIEAQPIYINQDDDTALSLLELPYHLADN